MRTRIFNAAGLSSRALRTRRARVMGVAIGLPPVASRGENPPLIGGQAVKAARYAAGMVFKGVIVPRIIAFIYTSSRKKEGK